MKLNKTGFLFAFFIVILVACMNSANDEKNDLAPQQSGYNGNQTQNNRINTSNEPRQDYAKWGKIALERTKEKYPNSIVSDYQYDTRRVNADGTVIDFFDFIITENKIEKDLKVKILHNPENGKLISVGFEEIS